MPPPAGFLSTLVMRREAKRGVMTHHLSHVQFSFPLHRGSSSPAFIPLEPLVDYSLGWRGIKQDRSQHGYASSQ
jgi:hypothetical protein